MIPTVLQCCFIYYTTLTKDCSCRKKEECLLEGKYGSEDIMFKCVVPTTFIHEKFTYVQQTVTLSNNIKIRKSHLEIEDKQIRHHYQNISRKWKVKDKHNTTPSLMWCIVKKCSRLFEYLEEMYVMPTWKVWNLKFGLSTSKKVSIIYFNKKPFKNDEKCFLFHFKSFCRSRDV